MKMRIERAKKEMPRIRVERMTFACLVLLEGVSCGSGGKVKMQRTKCNALPLS